MKKITIATIILFVFALFGFAGESSAKPGMSPNLQMPRVSLSVITCPENKFSTISFSVPSYWKGRQVKINGKIPRHIKRWRGYGIRFYELRIPKKRLGSYVRTKVTYRLYLKAQVFPQLYTKARRDLNCRL